MIFQVDGNGSITLKQPISHTDHPNMTFTIVAVDNGIPSLNDTATVFIDVMDQNTHRPEFVQDFYNVEERSDARVGDTVVTVTAIDLDLGKCVYITVHPTNLYWCAMDVEFLATT